MVTFQIIDNKREVVLESEDSIFKVSEPYRIKINGKRVIIPAGFQTNLASVPKIFWSIFPPFGKYTTPSVVHDYLYNTNKLSREEADLLFLLLMQEFGVSKITRSFFYYTVRLFGASHYAKNK